VVNAVFKYFVINYMSLFVSLLLEYETCNKAVRRLIVLFSFLNMRNRLSINLKTIFK